MNAFLQSLQSGNVKQIKKAMEKSNFRANGSLMPPKDPMGHYPVLCAVAESGHVEIAKIILEKKVPNLLYDI
jgi:hypothetical protein